MKAEIARQIAPKGMWLTQRPRKIDLIGLIFHEARRSDTSTVVHKPEVEDWQLDELKELGYTVKENKHGRVEISW